MQEYTEIQKSDLIRDSREKLLNNDKTAISCNSGSSFPTINLQAGMLCYRTDENALYQLKADGATWIKIMDCSGTVSKAPNAESTEVVAMGDTITPSSSITLSTGLSTSPVCNANFPTSFGNVINVSGDGKGQLLLGWNQSTEGIERLYYRSIGESSTSWTNWQTIAFTSDIKDSVPVGSVMMFAGNTTPSGYLLCDGSAVSRSTYSALYNVIGTTYGSGNGSTTFNLPLLTDSRFIEGANTPGTTYSAGLPDLHGTFGRTPAVYGLSEPTEVFARKSFTQGHNQGFAGGGYYNGMNIGTDVIDFGASRSSTIYGRATTVQPKALTLRPVIKY